MYANLDTKSARALPLCASHAVTKHKGKKTH